jgi:hypothetical protein
MSIPCQKCQASTRGVTPDAAPLWDRGGDELAHPRIGRFLFGAAS